MESISTYKERALDSLEGQWGNAAIVTLVFFLIYEGIDFLAGTFIPDTPGMVFSALWFFICCPLVWSFGVMFLGFIRGEDLSVGKLFVGYKDSVRIFITYLLYIFSIVLGCFFFVIPGIILALMFSQACFILKDRPDFSAIDALRMSAKMMKGHKTNYFLLLLSFIGWAILSFLTLGIGVLFLQPYIYTTTAHYYEDLKAESSTFE
jgi:uncharacterized membrane protein